MLLHLKHSDSILLCTSRNPPLHAHHGTRRPVLMTLRIARRQPYRPQSRAFNLLSRRGLATCLFKPTGCHVEANQELLRFRAIKLNALLFHVMCDATVAARMIRWEFRPRHLALLGSRKRSRGPRRNASPMRTPPIAPRLPFLMLLLVLFLALLGSLQCSRRPCARFICKTLLSNAKTYARRFKRRRSVWQRTNASLGKHWIDQV